MRQLTATDNAFLAIESGARTSHVGSLAIGPEATFAATKAHHEQRLGLLTPFRRRLVEVPLGLDDGYWIEAGDFDLDDHFRQLPLDDAKRVKARHGVTLNDVVLALCASALRRWLLDHEALPATPLLASARSRSGQGRRRTCTRTGSRSC